MTKNKKNIKECEDMIEMLQEEHLQADMYLDDLHDDSEAGISKLETELEAIEDDIQVYLIELKKLKAIK